MGVHSVPQGGTDLVGRLHHQGGRVQLAQPPDQLGHLGLPSHAHAEQQLAGRDEEVVMGIEDHDAGYLSVERPLCLNDLEQRGTKIVDKALQPGPRLTYTRVPHPVQDTKFRRSWSSMRWLANGRD